MWKSYIGETGAILKRASWGKARILEIESKEGTGSTGNQPTWHV
jgi:hypothetical protein